MGVEEDVGLGVGGGVGLSRIIFRQTQQRGTHGLRRGLHCFAASRLTSGSSGPILLGTFVFMPQALVGASADAGLRCIGSIWNFWRWGRGMIVGLGVGGGVGLSRIIFQQTRQRLHRFATWAALYSFAPSEAW